MQLLPGQFPSQMGKIGWGRWGRWGRWGKGGGWEGWGRWENYLLFSPQNHVGVAYQNPTEVLCWVTLPST
ncbi:hypothetical protein [Phormidium nigroviride]